MKTLKKTLCLVLAVVMAVGVLILPANADMETYEGFQDTDEVNPDYLEAVATLTGMGIISGKSDTAFVPTASVTRAEAASLIVKTLTTPAGHDLAVLGSSHPFTDVGAAHKWADANIGYAYEAGIVSGKTDTTFAPDATVTGYELLTMLMKATGYEPKTTSDNWKSKAVEFAREYNIFETGLEDVLAGPDKPLTREETAQMIWQAINHAPDGTVTENFVVYHDKNTNGKQDSDEETIGEPVDSLIEALLLMQTWTKPANSSGNANYYRNTVNTGSIGDVLYHLTKKANTDPYGRTTQEWINSKKDKDNVYSSFARTPNKVYNDGVKLSDALKAVGFKDPTKVTVTVTNKYKADTTYGNGAPYSTDVEYKAGQHVEVYKTGDASAQVVVIDTFVQKLTDGNIVAAKDDNPAYVKIELEGVTYTKETTEFKKDQVVIFTVSTGADKTGTIIDMSVANFFKGTVTATNADGDYIRVDGAKKLKSAHAMAVQSNGKIEAATIDKDGGWTYDKAEYTYYEDSYGHLIFATTEEAVVVPTNYIYVIKTSAKGYNPEDDLLGTDGQDAIARARVIDLETGEMKDVNLAIGYSAEKGGYYYKNQNGGYTDLVTKENKLDEGFYKFAVLDDGSYAILREKVDPSKIKLEKNKAAVQNTTYYANASTKVYVTIYDEATKASTVTVYTGYTNFPKYEGEAIVTGDKNIATNIYIVATDPIETVVTPVNYAVYKGMGEKIQNKQYIEFYVNGEVVSYIDGNNENLVAGDVCNLKVTDGVAVAEEISVEEDTVTIVQNEFIVTSKSGLAYLTADTVIVDATKGYAVVDSVAVDKTVKVFTATSANGPVAMFIVITK